MKTNLKLSKLTILLIIFLVSELSLASDKIKIFDGKTSIENPFELPDPFLAPRLKKKAKSSIASRKSSTVYDDSPSINNVKLSDIEITGVVIGKKRRAFAKVNGVERVVVLREGMKIGENRAELRAILPGGLILVEKNINIYGQEEFLETIIPITR